MRIDCIVAHTDDETLGAGGTLARLSDAGADVHVFAVADGVSSRWTYICPEVWAAAVTTRQAMFRAACEHLRVQPSWPDTTWPDNALDTVSRLSLARLIEAYLASGVLPGAIYTHHPGDLNVDHRRVAEAVITATRPGGQYPVTNVYAMEVASSTEWAFGAVGPHFLPNTFSPIEDTLERKLAAMACYDTEQPQSPHPRSREMLIARAQYWGSVAGCPAAEAFQLIRSLQ